MADTRFDVAVLVGSLRKESFNRKIAQAMIEIAPETLALSIVEIGNLPFFNQDDEPKPPAAWVEFRGRIERADAVLFVTPEYNRSVPAVLKNAIDVASRPYGQSKWDGKPATVVSVSPSAIGAFGANHHLRQSLVFLNMPALQQEAYIGHVDKLLDGSGKLTSDSTREFLRKHLEAFASWIARTRRAK